MTLFSKPFKEQKQHNIRFDWGLDSFKNYHDCSDVFVAVDVFSYSYYVEQNETESLFPMSRVLTLKDFEVPIFAGCLRNAQAVALKAITCGSRITVIAMGDEQGLLGFRPNFEDLMGAGAILRELGGDLSQEAQSAIDSFELNEGKLLSMLARCSGGKILKEQQGANDLIFCSRVDHSRQAPRLV